MAYLHGFLTSFIWILCRIAPALLLGFLISGLMSLIFTAARIKKHLGGTGFWPIFKAVLIGVPLPLCSCGVVPVAAALRKEGASRGATAAFYVATPQIGVNSCVLTVSILGWGIAAVRIAVAFVTGIISGLLIGRFADEGEKAEEAEGEHHCCCHHKEEPKPADEGEHHCCCHHKEEPKPVDEGEHHCCCHHKEEPKPADEGEHHCCCHKKSEGGSVFYRIIDYGFGRLPVSISPSLLTGLAVGAVIQFLVPDDFGASYLAGHSVLEFAALIIIAIPIYVCSSGAVPIAASLVLKGFSPGAALVFMLVGPASNAAMLTTMTKLLGIKSTAIYITALSIVAIFAGILLNVSGYSMAMDYVAGNSDGVHCITLFQQFCGALLFALLVRGLIVRFKSRKG